MLRLSQLAGWNQTAEQLEKLASEFPESNLIAVYHQENQDIPAGSGLVIPIGESMAWIGMILVDPEFRRKGIASAIMQRCLQLAENTLNCRVIGLDATPMGHHVYQKLGFEPSFQIWRCTMATNESIAIDSGLVVEPIDDLTVCFDFIKEIDFGYKVPWFSLIKKLSLPYLWVAKQNHRIAGLIMSRPGRLRPHIGPLVAESSAVARTLLASVLGYWNSKGKLEVFIDIPEFHFEKGANPTGCSFIQNVEISRPFIRMYRMPQVDQSPPDKTDGAKEKTESENTGVLKMNLLPADIAVEFVSNERDSLKYLFACGGPELS